MRIPVPVCRVHVDETETIKVGIGKIAHVDLVMEYDEYFVGSHFRIGAHLFQMPVAVLLINFLYWVISNAADMTHNIMVDIRTPVTPYNLHQ